MAKKQTDRLVEPAGIAVGQRLFDYASGGYFRATARCQRRSRATVPAA